MPIQIINGFPQYFEIGHEYGRFYGNIITQENGTYTDIDLQSDLVGDAILFDIPEVQLMSITRDGAVLLNDAGYEIISSNVVRLTPQLLDGEIVEFKKLTAVADIGNIPVNPVPGAPLAIEKTHTNAVSWTDASGASINAYPAFLDTGKTRIRTHFTFSSDEIEVYINGQFISSALLNSLNQAFWTIVDIDTIELDGDYSSMQTSVQIIKKTYGEA